MIGKIVAIYPECPSTVYNYVCEGESGRFPFPVEFRYHIEILDARRPLIGKLVDYNDDCDPPCMEFLD